MAKKLWGGRFKKKIDEDFFEFQKSIHVDFQLAKYDVYHSLIHVAALKNAGLLKSLEAQKLTKALKRIDQQIAKGSFSPNLGSEDIHTEIQNKVEKEVGALALKLHTLRSRNDQVAFDEKSFCAVEAFFFCELLTGLLESFSDLAQCNKAQAFVGYTHTQRAQVIEFSDYLGAYVSMFGRDLDRLKGYLSRLKIEIGAGALAGTSLPKSCYARAIASFKILKKGMVIPAHNSVDQVSSRDFIAELLSVLSILQMHLSRLAEDLILYSTQEYDFLDIPEEFCTGSSLMPHKKNADFLELVRGNTGKVYGNLVAILTLMKGLPLSYNRDMQLDKEPLFSSVSVVADELKIMISLIKGLRLNKKAVARALCDKTLYATELAEWLVRYQKVAFKKAHDIVGRLIVAGEKLEGGIDDLSEKALAKIHPALNKKVLSRVMSAAAVLSLRKKR